MSIAKDLHREATSLTRRLTGAVREVAAQAQEHSSGSNIEVDDQRQIVTAVNTGQPSSTNVVSSRQKVRSHQGSKEPKE